MPIREDGYKTKWLTGELGHQFSTRLIILIIHVYNSEQITNNCPFIQIVRLNCNVMQIKVLT